jgi:hypothetical protein
MEGHGTTRVTTLADLWLAEYFRSMWNRDRRDMKADLWEGSQWNILREKKGVELDGKL